MSDARPALFDLPSFESLTPLIGLPPRRQQLFDAFGSLVGVVSGTREPSRLVLQQGDDGSPELLHLYELEAGGRLGPFPIGRSGDWTVFTPDGRNLGSIRTRERVDSAIPSTTPAPWSLRGDGEQRIGRATMRFHWLQVVPFVGEVAPSTTDIVLHDTPAAVCTRGPSFGSVLRGRPAIRSRIDVLPTHLSDDDRLLVLAAALLAAR